MENPIIRCTSLKRSRQLILKNEIIFTLKSVSIYFILPLFRNDCYQFICTNNTFDRRDSVCIELIFKKKKNNNQPESDFLHRHLRNYLKLLMEIKMYKWGKGDGFRTNGAVTTSSRFGETSNNIKMKCFENNK